MMSASTSALFLLRRVISFSSSLRILVSSRTSFSSVCRASSEKWTFFVTISDWSCTSCIFKSSLSCCRSVICWSVLLSSWVLSVLSRGIPEGNFLFPSTSRLSLWWTSIVFWIVCFLWFSAWISSSIFALWSFSSFNFPTKLVSCMWYWETALSSLSCSFFKEVITLSKSSFCLCNTQMSSLPSSCKGLSLAWCSTFLRHSSCTLKSLSRSDFSWLNLRMALSKSFCCLSKSDTFVCNLSASLSRSEPWSPLFKIKLSCDWKRVSLVALGVILSCVTWSRCVVRDLSRWSLNCLWTSISIVVLFRFRIEISCSSSAFSLFIIDMVSSTSPCFLFRLVIRSSRSALSLFSDPIWLSDSALSRFKAEISSSTSNFLRLSVAISSSSSSFFRCMDDSRLSRSYFSLCKELTSPSLLLKLSSKDAIPLSLLPNLTSKSSVELDNRRFKLAISSWRSFFSRLIADRLSSCCWFSYFTAASSLSFSRIISFSLVPLSHPSAFEIRPSFISVRRISLLLRFSSSLARSRINTSRSWVSADICRSKSSHLALSKSASLSCCWKISPWVDFSSINFCDNSFSIRMRTSSLSMVMFRLMSSLSISNCLRSSSRLSAYVSSICAFSCFRSAISSPISWIVSSNPPFSLTSPSWYLSSSFSFKARFSSEYLCSISDISSSNLSSSFRRSSLPFFSISFLSFSMISKSSFSFTLIFLRSEVSFSRRIINSASKLAFKELLCSKKACSISFISLSNLVIIMSFSWFKLSFSSFSCNVNFEISICKSEMFSSYFSLCFSSSLPCFSSNFRRVSWSICKYFFSMSFLSLSEFISHFSFSWRRWFSASLFCQCSSETVVFISAIFVSYFILSCSNRRWYSSSIFRLISRFSKWKVLSSDSLSLSYLSSKSSSGCIWLVKGPLFIRRYTSAISRIKLESTS